MGFTPNKKAMKKAERLRVALIVFVVAITIAAMLAIGYYVLGPLGLKILAHLSSKFNFQAPFIGGPFLP